MTCDSHYPSGPTLSPEVLYMCRTQESWAPGGQECVALPNPLPHNTVPGVLSSNLSPEQVLLFLELFQVQLSNCLSTMNVLANQSTQYGYLLRDIMTRCNQWIPTPWPCISLESLLREVDTSRVRLNTILDNLTKELEAKKTALRVAVNYNSSNSASHPRPTLIPAESVIHVPTVCSYPTIAQQGPYYSPVPLCTAPSYYTVNSPLGLAPQPPQNQSSETLSTTTSRLTTTLQCNKLTTDKDKNEQIEPIDLSNMNVEESLSEDEDESKVPSIVAKEEDVISTEQPNETSSENVSPQAVRLNVIVSSHSEKANVEQCAMATPTSSLCETREKRWPCPEPSCSKKFDSRSLLDVHYRIHTGARPFKCPNCPRAFRQLGQVQKHIKSIHTRQLEFACDECPRAFVDRTSLQYHTMARHRPISERPFGCDLCRKRFITQNDVRRHVICCHSGRGEFKCDDCDRVFHLFCHLNEHRKKHEPVPYQCRYCANTFRNLNRLKTHEALKHRA